MLILKDMTWRWFYGTLNEAAGSTAMAASPLRALFFGATSSLANRQGGIGTLDPM